MNTTTAVLVTLTATSTSERLPANRLAVAPAVFARLCRESAACGSLSVYDELHITALNDELDVLDDELRARAQTVGEFDGRECWTLLPGQGIDGCDVWARCAVEAAEAETV
jgi:hypothetical protein